MSTTMAGQKLHKQGELSTAAGGSTPKPLSSRTLLSMHKYYRQKCSLLFWRYGRTPRFLDQFSRFVGLALVTNRCTTQTLFPAVHLPSICFLYIGALAMELWTLSKVGRPKLYSNQAGRDGQQAVCTNFHPRAELYYAL